MPVKFTLIYTISQANMRLDLSEFPGPQGFQENREWKDSDAFHHPLLYKIELLPISRKWLVREEFPNLLGEFY